MLISENSTFPGGGSAKTVSSVQQFSTTLNILENQKMPYSKLVLTERDYCAILKGTTNLLMNMPNQDKNLL